MTNRAFFYILPLVILISLFVFYPTFNLALSGDNWLAFWRYSYYAGDNSPVFYKHLTYFVTPYGAQDVTMGLLRNIFGYESFFYYLTSYILRLFASISLLLLAYQLTKSKLAATFGALFFSITVIGFDTTDWVFNMPSYMSITFFNLFLYFFIRFRENNKIGLFFISVLLFYLAHVFSPIRMTGLLLFTLLLESFLYLKEPTKKVLKQTLLQIFTFIIVFLFISYAGKFPDGSSTLTGIIGKTLIESFITMQQFILSGRFDFLFYPFLTLGRMLIPDTFTIAIGVASSTTSLFISRLMPLFFIFMLINFLLLKNITKLDNKFFKITTFVGFISTVLTALMHYHDKLTLSYSSAISILFGLYLITLVITLFWSLRKINNASSALFIAISWTIMSFIFVWIRAPDTIFPTVHRYLIVAAVGLALIFSVIISLGQNFKSKVMIVCLLSIVLLIHVEAARRYTQEILSYHSQDITNKIWSGIPYIPEAGKSIQPLVFYLENDGSNGALLHTNLGFNLDYHIALMYNISDWDKTPIIMDSWDYVVSAVSDGKSFAAYNHHEQKPIPVNNVYAFRLEGRDHLINITDSVRKKLNDIKTKDE